MIDVHVLVMPDTPKEWIEQRRDSLSAAVAAAGYPVNVFEVPGVIGHIGKARAAGYAKGHAKYVTYVDDDDWVEENAFAILQPHLDGSTDAIFTSEWIHPDEGEPYTQAAPHHLCVYRRPVLDFIPFDQLTWAVDVHSRHEAEGRVTVHLPEAVYHYRALGRSAPLRVLDRGQGAKRPFDAEAMPASYWRSL